MNIESVKRHLRSWMQVSTWNTSHPLDQQRFHRALHNCFREHGPGISSDVFEDAMLQLLDELYPTPHAVDRTERVRDWVLKAEAIDGYMYDIR